MCEDGLIMSSVAPTDSTSAAEQRRRTGLAKWIRRLAVPIILGWIALVVLLSLTVPPLQGVGQDFEEFKSDSAVMIVLEGEERLGPDAHHYYDQLVDKLEADKTYVEHVQDFWGDPLTE